MQKTDQSMLRIIFTGTDPDSARGGIGVVLPGYFLALDSVNIEYECLPTYHPARPGGKWIPWIKAFPILYRKIRFSKKNGAHPIVYSHAGDGVSLFREMCVLWAARLFGSQTLLHVHSPKVNNYLTNPFKTRLLKVAFVPANTICVLTQWWKERLEAAGIDGHIRVVPNPLPPALLEKALGVRHENTKHDKESVTVLSMARLVDGKGVDVMIRALAELPQSVRLVIAGDGDKRDDLQHLVEDLQLTKRVQFTGWVSGQEKAKLLDNADIFCLPSTYDAFPMSMVEAMAYGLPVVAVRWGGIPDMVADGRAGILVNHPEPGEIAGAIHALLDNDKRCAMGHDARRWIFEISSPDQVGQRLKEIIWELTG